MKTQVIKRWRKEWLVFRIIPDNRLQQQLMPNAGKANNSRRCSHYRLPSPSQLCTTSGYVTKKPCGLPGGHLLVISEMKFKCSGRFDAVFIQSVIILRILNCLYRPQDKQSNLMLPLDFKPTVCVSFPNTFYIPATHNWVLFFFF